MNNNNILCSLQNFYSKKTFPLISLYKLSYRRDIAHLRSLCICNVIDFDTKQ